ncbi:hypothetical protein D7Y57_22645 [Stenotrophomonas maltophilia]|nr:hypothetical protein [Stenotrophomonas maltophilia]
MGEGALLAKHCFASARTRSRRRLGRTAERDLRRVLQARTAPPTHGMLAVAVAGQRPALPQVQGRRPCRTPFTPRRARPAAVRAWCRAAARRSSSRSA